MTTKKFRNGRLVVLAAAAAVAADTTAEVNKIKSEVDNEVQSESAADVFKITGQVVKAAAATMKNNKSDVSGSYVLDAVKNAPDIFFENIACVFRSWMFHGTVTTSLLACAFMPLLKNALKNLAETKSYLWRYGYTSPLFSPPPQSGARRGEWWGMVGNGGERWVVVGNVGE